MMMLSQFIQKVWVDQKEISAAKAVIRATAQLARGASATPKAIHNGSECTLTIRTADAFELYHAAAHMKRVRVAILKDGVVSIACGLLIIGMEETTDEPFTVFDMRYGEPPQLRSEKEWMAHLEVTADV